MDNFLHKASVNDIINYYNIIVKFVDSNAQQQIDRAYGGFIRETKGHLQEIITERIIYLAWERIGGKRTDIEVNSKKIQIPICEEYINNMNNKVVKNYILQHKKDYYYGLSVDKHVFIKKQFVMGIECKAYTENAMIKRILVDFHLLKSLYPNISSYLFQLESQLTGDYSSLNKITYGSKSTHSIMSYFNDVDLKIFTFLQGERKVNEPIHKKFKPLKAERIELAICLLGEDMKQYIP